MKPISYLKAHGAENDFLLSWADQTNDSWDLPEVARRICARNTGVGADGWMRVWKEEAALRTQLFNSDGSEAEISGNGTRCAAAFALWTKTVHAPEVEIITAAGRKKLSLIHHNDQSFVFEMNMGLPEVAELRATLLLRSRTYDATILNVGNPQCAIFVPEIEFGWQKDAAMAEAHPRFPRRSNVSFVRVIDRHTIDAVFYERGAGETRSSGTGSTGAATAAILRGEVESPVRIQTPAGDLTLRWTDSVYLTGPAEIVAEGTYYFDVEHRQVTI